MASYEQGILAALGLGFRAPPSVAGPRWEDAYYRRTFQYKATVVSTNTSPRFLWIGVYATPFALSASGRIGSG